MILGLTGSFASGKDTVARYLVKKGFFYHSLSDLIREELKKQGKAITRQNLIDTGNDVRKKFGAGEWAKRALAGIQQQKVKKSLVVSIRNPEEVTVLRQAGDFRLWFVDAPAEIRFQRTLKRRRSDDFKSFEEFLEKERKENSSDPHSQQLAKVFAMADVKIINDKDLESLYRILDKLIYNLSRPPRADTLPSPGERV